jgi:hypothetical protein
VALAKTRTLYRKRKGAAPVVFQDVVPFFRHLEPHRRRIGAKVEIGCNDFQGADLSRRLLHGSAARLSFLGFQAKVQRLDHLQAPEQLLNRAGFVKLRVR